MPRKKSEPTQEESPQASGFLPLLECAKAWGALHTQFLMLMEARSRDPFNAVFGSQISQTLLAMEELERNYLSLLDEYFITHWARLQGAALAKMIAEETAPGNKAG